MSDWKENLLCEAACSRLIADFAYFVDSRQYEGLVDLLAEDCSFERRGTVLAGRAAILEAMRARPEDLVTRHACTNIRIDQTGPDSASGVCTLLMFHGTSDQQAESTTIPYSITVAEYRDTFVATPEGWRFASRVAHIVF